jgi:hypothetical protein
MIIISTSIAVVCDDIDVANKEGEKEASSQARFTPARWNILIRV